MATMNMDNIRKSINDMVGPEMAAVMAKNTAFQQDLSDYCTQEMTPGEFHEALGTALQIGRDDNALSAEAKPSGLTRTGRTYKAYVLMNAAELNDLAEHLSLTLINLNIDRGR